MDGFGIILHKFLLKSAIRSSTVANNSPNLLYGRRIHMEAPVSVLRGFMVISTKPNSRYAAWVQRHNRSPRRFRKAQGFAHREVFTVVQAIEQCLQAFGVNVLVNAILLLFPEGDYFTFHCRCAFVCVSGERASTHLLEHAEALFELVCFGVFTNLAGLPTMPFGP